MINYCSFAVAYLRGKIPGQDTERDMFNQRSEVMKNATSNRK